MHLRILPDHQNQVLKKLFVSRLGWLKTCFNAFAHTFRPLEWLKTCFDAFPDHQNQVLYKFFFSPLEWVKTCFYAFPGQQNQVFKKLFFDVWSGEKRFLMHFQTTRNHPKSEKIIF